MFSSRRLIWDSSFSHKVVHWSSIETIEAFLLYQGLLTLLGKLIFKKSFYKTFFNGGMDWCESCYF